MILPDSFQSKRLNLRPPRLDDAQAMFNGYSQDPEVTKYLIWRPHSSIEDTLAFLKMALLELESGNACHYVIERKGDGQLMGTFSLELKGSEALFGFAIGKPYWGQGYVSEALKAVLDWTMAQEGIRRAYATCDVDNLASARVMEKAGMKLEGRLPKHALHPNIGDERRDSFLYSIQK